MYTTYFGFQQIPFNTELKPEDYFYGSSARRVSDDLIRSITNQASLMFLTGEKGTGKSSLMRSIGNAIDSRYRFIFPQRYIDSFPQFLELLHGSLGVGDPSRKSLSVQQTTTELCEYFPRLLAKDQRCILVVDDMENIAPEVVQELIEFSLRPENTALQIVLVGLPLMTSMIDELEIPSLQDRIGCSVRLDDFEAEEIAWFIDHRLALAGYDGPPLFTGDAIEKIRQYTGGNPGLISALCGFSLLNVSIENRQQVTSEIIDEEAKHCIFKRDSLPSEAMDFTAPDSTILLPCASQPGFERTTETLIAGSQIEAVEESAPANPQSNDDTLERKDLCEALSSLANRYDELGIPLPGSDNEKGFVPDHPKVTPANVENEHRVGFVERWTSRIGRPGFTAWNANIVYGFLSGLLIVGLTGFSFLYKNQEKPDLLASPEAPQIASPTVSEFVEPVNKPDDLPVSTARVAAEQETRNSPVKEKDMQIQAMLERAETQISSRHLIEGDGENALETYREISRLVNRQMEALNDLVHLRQLYQRWGLEAEIQENWKEAEVFYAQALKISPQDPKLTSAMARVKLRLASEATRAAMNF